MEPGADRTKEEEEEGKKKKKNESSLVSLVSSTRLKRQMESQ